MKPSTSLGTTSNVGMANPSPSVRPMGNMRCLLMMGGVYRSSVSGDGYDVNYRCRCRVKLAQKQACTVWFDMIGGFMAAFGGKCLSKINFIFVSKILDHPFDI